MWAPSTIWIRVTAPRQGGGGEQSVVMRGAIGPERGNAYPHRLWLRGNSFFLSVPPVVGQPMALQVVESHDHHLHLGLGISPHRDMDGTMSGRYRRDRRLLFAKSVIVFQQRLPSFVSLCYLVACSEVGARFHSQLRRDIHFLRTGRTSCRGA